MHMVMVVNTGAFVLFLLLSASLLSSARLHPGAEVNAPSSASMISNDDATASTIKSREPAIIFGDESKSSKKVNVVETSLTLPSSSSSLSSHNYNERRKRRLRRHWSDEADKGFVSFSADYHGPRHHPPKNN